MSSYATVEECYSTAQTGSYRFVSEGDRMLTEVERDWAKVSISV